MSQKGKINELMKEIYNHKDKLGFEKEICEKTLKKQIKKQKVKEGEGKGKGKGEKDCKVGEGIDRRQENAVNQNKQEGRDWKGKGEPE